MMKSLFKKNIAMIVTFIMLCSAVQANELPKDDYPNSAREAEYIDFRQDIVGAINYKGDIDYFGFQAPGHMNIKVILEGDTVNYGIIDVARDDQISEDTVLEKGKLYAIIVYSKNPDRVPSEANTYKLRVEPKLLDEEPQWGKYGDVNGDGELNSIDFALMKKVLLGMDLSNMTFDYDAADLDGDGSFTSTDYGLLNQYLLGKRSTFPSDSNGDGYIND